MNPLFVSSSFILFLLFSFPAIGQSEEELFREADEYRKTDQYTKGLKATQKLLELNPNKPEYLNLGSFFYSMVGQRLDDKSKQETYFQKAHELSQRSLSLDSTNAFTHYAYALALGVIHENAPTKEKLQSAREIKKACEKAIELNPELAGAYHVLGRWHRTFANFNMVERGMVNTFYGGVPEGGNYEDALEHFKQAVRLQPSYLLHLYELAVTYQDMGKEAHAKAFAEKLMEMEADTPKDEEAQAKGKELLKGLN